MPSSSGNKSYDTLFNSYGVYQSNTLMYGTQDVRTDPLYLVYSGGVDSCSLGGVGFVGYYRSSRASSDAFALLLSLHARVSPSDSSYRYLGFSVRCVSEGGEGANTDNVSVTVGSMISLDVTNNVTIDASEMINPATSELNVKVESNKAYTVQINAVGHADLKAEGVETSIPSSGGTLTTAENNWGIKKPNESNYTKVTTAAETFYQSDAAEVKTILFEVGVSVSPNIPVGMYSTGIVVTAVQN